MSIIAITEVPQVMLAVFYSKKKSVRVKKLVWTLPDVSRKGNCGLAQYECDNM